MSPITTQTAIVFQPAMPPLHKYEVADIFRIYGPSYQRNFSLPLSHLKVMRAIVQCRTAELGGHIERCEVCGYEHNAYNSCRNRHCPKCQALAKAEWLDKRRMELLPVGYFHCVFTLPHELNQIIMCNKKVIYDILFETVSETLQEFAADPKHGLRGRLGITAILHTWDQKLLTHTHLHCVVPGGVLSFDGNRWIHARENFLFPVRALSKVFRGKFIHCLKKSFSNDDMNFPRHLADLADKAKFSRFINKLWGKEWVVYSKAPFDGPQKVLDYLGRYTHRVAISNNRILKVKDDSVTLRYRDRADRNKCKNLKIDAHEFIRRFLLHVLPDSFIRIRHYGFLANRSKRHNLAKCRELLGLPPELPKTLLETIHEKMLRLTKVDITACPRCKKGRMKYVKELLPAFSIRHSIKSFAPSEGFDTS
jgi:predicted Zn-ribbon and HTH transcriptional regulator